MDKNLQKTISVCIVGKPNAGKSSLLNKIIGHKISIVTPKVQTTRSIITGILTIENVQIILFDTPGIFEPKKTLERAMVRCAWSSMNGADIVMLIVDSSKPLDQFTIDIITRMQSLKIKPVFLLNKTDLISKELVNTTNTINEYFEEAKILKISALTGKGINELLDYITNKASFAPWLYDQDDLTNLPMRFLASEITREQLFLNLHEELPYNLTVHTENWQVNNDKSIKINQAIIVSRENYKAMILGHKGSMIKEIGSKARTEMEKSFEERIHLFLFIKVRELWDQSSEFYHYMGLKLEKNLKSK